MLPGFRLTLGFTLFYLSAIVLIPLAALVLRAAHIGWDGFLEVLSSQRVQSAFRVTFCIAFLAAAIDMVLGLLLAWVLVRYRFPGRRILDALVDEHGPVGGDGRDGAYLRRRRSPAGP